MNFCKLFSKLQNSNELLNKFLKNFSNPKRRFKKSEFYYEKIGSFPIREYYD
jgi:hypothetical protein